MRKSFTSVFASMIVTAAALTTVVATQSPSSGAPSPQARSQAQIEDRVITLRSACDQSKALTTTENGNGGGSLSLQVVDGSLSQQFRAQGAGGNLQLISKSTGLLITPESLKAQAPVNLFFGIGVEASNWKVTFTRRGFAEFTPLFGDGLRLDLKYAQTNPGSTFHLWARNGTCAQRFVINVVETPTPTTVPDTTVPETTVPETTVPATTVPETTPTTATDAPAPTTTALAPTTLAPTTLAPTTSEPAVTVAPTTTAAPVTTLVPTTTAPKSTGGFAGQKWVRLEGNLTKTGTLETLIGQVKTAKAGGADTIMFADTKLNLWYVAPGLGDQWASKMKQFANAVRAEGMKLILQSAPVGYCTPVLFHDPNLTTGYPIVDAAFTVRNGELVPEQTVALKNGSFESSFNNVPTDWGFQDFPGTNTFIDTTVAKSGNASMRFEGVNSPDRLARIFTTVSVKPFTQYTLRFWMKSSRLTNGYMGPVVVGREKPNEEPRKLTAQYFSFSDGNSRSYVPFARNLTKDWTEMSIAFNSLDETEVRLGFGSWDTKEGTLWIDDVRLEDTPLLNVIRRNDLPLTMRTDTGRTVTEGNDVTAIIDPQLGQIEYTGNFDTYHGAPIAKLAPSSSLREGERVLLNAHHALVTMGAQVGCSWQNPRVFEIMKEIHVQAERNFAADGYLVDLEEVRTGGWEPADAKFGSSGASLGSHGQRVLKDAAEVTGKPIYVWGDMLEPTQNAVNEFYHVKSTLVGSWLPIDRNVATIVNWKDGPTTKTLESAQHFAGLQFKQIIAGFYDADVAENYDRWKNVRNVAGVEGSMYTTFAEDLSKIPAFASLWWT
jgi:hypothetical protein